MYFQEKIFKNKQYLFIILLFGLNMVLKSWYLESRDIAGDEPFSIFHSQQSVKEIVAMLQNENNPPLHFLLLHYWMKLFGMSTFSIRFSSVIFSSLAAVFIFLIGHNYSCFRTGLVASLLFTFSNMQIYHAHEARVYALFAFLTAASMYVFFKMNSNPEKKSSTIILSIVNALLIYSHFFGWFIPGIQALIVLFIKDFRTKISRKLLLAHLITFCLYLPYLGLAISRFSASSGGTWLSKPSLAGLYDMLRSFSNEPLNTVIFLMIIILGAFFFFLNRHKNNAKLGIYYKSILVWFIVPFLFMFIISFVMPMFFARYLIFISVGYFLLIAFSVEFIRGRNYLKVSIAAILVVLMAVTARPNIDNLRKPAAVAKEIVDIKQDGTLVFICPPWIKLTIGYYYSPDFFNDYRRFDEHLKDDGIFSIYNATEIDTLKLINATDAIYVNGFSKTDPTGSIDQLLEKRFPNKKQLGDYKGFYIWHYTE